MIRNLFSSFDPSRNFFLPLNWLSSLLFILFFPYIFWVIPSRYNIIWNKITLTLHKEFKIILSPNYKGRTIIFIRLFTIILINNFLGLFPYIFTRTRHIVITLSLALPLWLSFMLFGWINNTTHIFAHLVPIGTPRALISFIVLIETIRNMIRPGTLAIRLTANIIAGHLLLTLLGNNGPNLSLVLVNILILAQLILIILETAVAIIQSYVFTVLRTLYSREVI